MSSTHTYGHLQCRNQCLRKRKRVTRFWQCSLGAPEALGTNVICNASVQRSIARRLYHCRRVVLFALSSSFVFVVVIHHHHPPRAILATAQVGAEGMVKQWQDVQSLLARALVAHAKLAAPSEKAMLKRQCKLSAFDLEKVAAAVIFPFLPDPDACNHGRSRKRLQANIQRIASEQAVFTVDHADMVIREMLPFVQSNMKACVAIDTAVATKNIELQNGVSRPTPIQLVPLAEVTSSTDSSTSTRPTQLASATPVALAVTSNTNTGTLKKTLSRNRNPIKNQLRCKAWHLKRRCDSLSKENERMKTEIAKMHAKHCYKKRTKRSKSLMGGQVSLRGGYRMALKRNVGHASCLTTLSMLDIGFSKSTCAITTRLWDILQSIPHTNSDR